jgi:hypothetical protein
LHFASSWAELHGSVEAGLFDLAMIDPTFSAGGDRAGCLREIHRLARYCPPERLILYVPAGQAHLLRHLGEHGFLYCCMLGIDDDPGSLLRIVARAASRQLLRRHLISRGQPCDDVSLGVVLQGVTGWPPAGTVTELAGRVAMSSRSLRRLSASRGLSPPGRLLAIGRIMDLTLLVQLGVRSRTRLAAILNTGGPDALAHLVLRHLKVPISTFLGSAQSHDPAEWLAPCIFTGGRGA